MSALQWFIVPALAALGRNVKTAQRVITAPELSKWATDAQLDFPLGIADLALASLQRHGYLAPQAQAHYKRGAINRWTLTRKGLQAAQAALKTMPGAMPDVQALPTRVWNLLRIRRRMTAAEAADTLIDAQDDFPAQTKRIGALLAAWAKLSPFAVVTALKREAGGRIRYVLINDLGRWPPPSQIGQMHPTDFAQVLAIPSKYRKDRDVAPGTDAGKGKGHEAT